MISFTVFMCAISWLGELTVWNLLPGKGAVNVIVSGAIGAFFIGMGNYLPRVRQNYTLGIKTPWALDDPDQLAPAPTVSAEPVSWWWALA